MGYLFNPFIEFFTKKTLINFNNSGFSWNGEGTDYLMKSKTPSKMTNIMESIIYDDGKYYKVFITITEWIWLLVLTSCLFIAKKEMQSISTTIIHYQFSIIN